MTGIRIEGTPEEIDEVVRRLRHALFVSSQSKLYDNHRNPDSAEKRCYLRIYVYERDTILDQLEAAQADLARTEEAWTRDVQKMRFEIDRLKDELGRLPKPQAYDAVLSPNTPILNNERPTNQSNPQR